MTIAPRVGTFAIPKERQKEAVSAIDGLLTQGWGEWFGGSTALNESSQRVIRNALWQDAAIATQAGGESYAKLIPDIYRTAIARGRIERYGAFAWTNPKDTQPLARVLGLQQAKGRDRGAGDRR
jgi:hypothetical protein